MESRPRPDHLVGATAQQTKPDRRSGAIGVQRSVDNVASSRGVLAADSPTFHHPRISKCP
jgi:hypothetical protein